MIRRGWLPGVDSIQNVPAVETALATFFGVSSIEEIEILPHAAKKTNVGADVTPTQLAWLYRVKQLAGDMLTPGRYSPSAVARAITALKTLTFAAEEARKVPRVLSDAGIRFVAVEALTSSKIDGVCFWLNDMSPVVGISLRYDRIDNFWFVIRHELEHVARRHGLLEAAIDADLEHDRAVGSRALPDEERIANEAASDFCVPTAKMSKFFSVKKPYFHERDILGFAKTLQIHPGLVAGQLQHRTGRYDLFRNHLVKIRSIVLASTRHDGWGDVAPVGQ
jgi:HTH-type transcriptional regulator/antitoxin HigA